ncbi:MAG: hypothetical protein GAK45_00791 [Pseudomonas citronellolis]|nr:MAG: hypothetical protein GAK45_00791 [Pseudomonas citronellolis]
MRPLSELLHPQPALPELHQWLAESPVHCELLPPSAQRDEVLLALQVTTHSLLGTLAHDSGGLLIEQGWLRLLGSGHPRLPRTLQDWSLPRGDGFLLVGDDVVGGFFALDGGAFGGAPGEVHYLAPDDSHWASLELGYSDFIQAMLAGGVQNFYADLRWDGWREDVARDVDGSQCLHFWPPLWSAEGSVQGSSRRAIPLEEAFGLRMADVQTV